jgi:hypothetical protein
MAMVSWALLALLVVVLFGSIGVGKTRVNFFFPCVVYKLMVMAMAMAMAMGMVGLVMAGLATHNGNLHSS